MTKSVSFEDRVSKGEKTGQLSWLLDSTLISAAALGVIVVFVGTSIITHRAKPAVDTIAMFASFGNPDMAEAAAGPTGAPLLWVVKDKNAKDGGATVYLFGSVPEIAGEARWMDQRLFGAFDNADSAWFDNGALPYVPAHASGGADLVLYRRADALGKGRLALDSNRAPPILAGSGLDVPYDAWRTGDQKAMTDAVNARARGDRDVYEALQVRRNQKWLPQLEQALTGKGTVFVTVDAGHLVGPDGLVAQLRKRGHSVVRLDPVTAAS